MILSNFVSHCRTSLDIVMIPYRIALLQPQGSPDDIVRTALTGIPGGCDFGGSDPAISPLVVCYDNRMHYDSIQCSITVISGVQYCSSRWRTARAALRALQCNPGRKDT